jgi:hypothetical protein
MELKENYQTQLALSMKILSEEFLRGSNFSEKMVGAGFSLR